MEESALNRAHLLERKADKLLNCLKFEEAIACHQRTADLLLEAMQLTRVEKVLESLELQRDYNIRKQAIIRYKQLLVRRLCMKKGMAKMRPSEEDAGLSSSCNFTSTKTAIYKNIEENDSLLRGLIIGPAPPEETVRSSVRTPKDDKIIIEELRVNNDALRHSVDKLITQLEESHQENKRLKAEIEELKSQMRQYESERNKLRIITDSGSPFVLSPSSELSPVGFRSLPTLAPLEMPNFDFNKFTSPTESSSGNSETLSS